jgi:hypothetical protein
LCCLQLTQLQKDQLQGSLLVHPSLVNQQQQQQQPPLLPPQLPPLLPQPLPCLRHPWGPHWHPLQLQLAQLHPLLLSALPQTLLLLLAPPCCQPQQWQHPCLPRPLHPLLLLLLLLLALLPCPAAWCA